MLDAVCGSASGSRRTHFDIRSLAVLSKTGATFGFLAALAYGLILYGATTMADLTYYMGDAVAFAVRYGAAGAVIAWLLGKGSAASAT